ncbi:MAG: excinuclease ABC subunit UvrB [Candidatus Paceibacterota bacterium]|jgi:excinuclease ABC subunit B
MSFHIIKKPAPAGDQPQAIKELTANFAKGAQRQTLLGVTGSGKTFTMAHVINTLDRPTLVISHNKTLAAQLYEEFKAVFPEDHVHYFVSYYDYYQPEAYLPTSDTYIEKEVQINDEIDQLRHAAVQSVLTHRNTIVVASVSCIYNLGSPETYTRLSLRLKVGQEITKRELLKKLLLLQFERNEIDFWHGRFRQRAEHIDIWPQGQDIFWRISIDGGVIREIKETEAPFGASHTVKEIHLFPAKFWPSEESVRDIALSNIKLDLQEQLEHLQKNGKPLEAERLKRRTHYDMALIAEVGWCKGMENYSRYFEGRAHGTPPFTLIDYFPKDFLLMVDESHMSLPQIRGMHRGDKARKDMLIDHGFRLPSALDNRPLTFEEFEGKVHQTLFASATPAEWELKESSHVAEQIVRPTFLLDPTIEIRKTEGQIPDLLNEIAACVAKKERVLVTVLTKRLAEALSDHLKEKKIKASYLHSEIDTLERPKILFDLRSGKYDVLVGINLLREGLDLPEVGLIAILDADKEGFLRDATSFIQISGRAARNLHGRVIMYADHVTQSMKKAISETARRRAVQEQYNKKHGTVPTQIVKDIAYTLTHGLEPEQTLAQEFARDYLKELKLKLDLAQRNLQFEEAARIQAQIHKFKKDAPTSAPRPNSSSHRSKKASR